MKYRFAGHECPYIIFQLGDQVSLTMMMLHPDTIWGTVQDGCVSGRIKQSSWKPFVFKQALIWFDNLEK